MDYGNAFRILHSIFRSYAGKDSALDEYSDVGLGLEASVVAHLVSMLPEVNNSNYNIVMDNFFYLVASTLNI